MIKLDKLLILGRLLVLISLVYTPAICEVVYKELLRIMKLSISFLCMLYICLVNILQVGDKTLRSELTRKLGKLQSSRYAKTLGKLSWLSFVFHLKALTHTHSTPLISHDNVMGYHWSTVCMYVSVGRVGGGGRGTES